MKKISRIFGLTVLPVMIKIINHINKPNYKIEHIKNTLHTT